MLNKVTLIGRTSADPEIKYMPNGSAVATLNIATSRRWKDKNTGERKEATEWHRVIFFNRLAEIAGEYLKKGSQIYVEGRLQTRKWEKDGQDHYTTEIVGEEMHMLGTKSSDGGAQSNKASRPQANSQTSAQQAPATDNWGDDFDDDVPF